MMISSLVYGICFIILASRKEPGVKIMAGLCLAYILLDHAILWFFENSAHFDITLYFTSAWALDSILLFAVGCFIRGARQIAIVSISIPLMLIQVFVIQYPHLFPDSLFVFALQQAHRYFIEVFIFVYSWKDNTIVEWLRTGTVICLVIISHLL